MDADPDLGQGISELEVPAARRELLGDVRTLYPGEWVPENDAVAAGTLGLLILDGLLRRMTVVAGAGSSELLGAGDVLRPWQTGGADDVVGAQVTWKVCHPVAVVTLDETFVRSAGRWPSVVDELAARLAQRADALALRAALVQVGGVQLRIVLLLWHLADRWGRVEHAGIALPFRLDQSTIGEMVGATRSRVSAALNDLEGDGRLQRRSESWLLSGPRPNLATRTGGPGLAIDAGPADVL